MKKFGDIYEFVYVNFYIKKKRDRCGYFTHDQYRAWNRTPSVSGHFIYTVE
jgi:hypothetical protein